MFLWPHEQNLMESKGGLLTPTSERWQMGVWCTTGRKLLFRNVKRVIWSCLYSTVLDLKFEERPFSFGTKNTLRIDYGKKKRPEPVWLLAPNLLAWERWIRNHAFPQALTEEALLKIAEEVDPLSEQLLWHLWKKKHATIDELTESGFSDDPKEILKCLKEIINPIAYEQFGFPLCVFLIENRDTTTNQTIQNSWWLNDLPFSSVLVPES